MTRHLSYDALLGVLVITTGTTETNYGIDSVAHEYGPAVRLVRLWAFGAAESFGVTVAAGCAVCSCSVPDCDHADAVAALVASGRLD